MEYFDHEDYKLRHECHQEPVIADLDVELKKMFKYLGESSFQL